MPELPEVETSRRGIAPFIEQQTVAEVIIRQAKLRWPIPDTIYQLEQQTIDSVARRGKYLLLQSKLGTAILHLGMSGRLHILKPDTPAGKHDHVDICFANDVCLRLTDPRRFGALLWTNKDPMMHPLLNKLGPEPLSDVFEGDYLYQRGHKLKRAIKQVIMDSHIVVGVGNIYACESLFLAGIHPSRIANRISKARYQRLAAAIKAVLTTAIAMGGTTLRDFLNHEAKPGYFKQELQVYGREGLKCYHCQTELLNLRLQGRATVYCPKCQR